MTEAAEFRSQSLQELKDQLLELKRKQFKSRILYRNGNFANTAEFKVMRRDIARVKTVINEMQGKN